MMQRICSFNETKHKDSDRIRISLDMEKTRFEFDALLPFVDVVFLGKDLAMHWGSMDKIDALKRFSQRFPDWYEFKFNLFICKQISMHFQLTANALWYVLGARMERSPKMPSEYSLRRLSTGDTSWSLIAWGLATHLPQP